MSSSSNKSRKPVLNQDIPHDPVRLIGQDGEQLGIVPLAKALAVAEAAEHDLVLMTAEAEPAVCKLMDYGKHAFERKKRRTASRKKQRHIHVKEVKFRPGTEEMDYQVKMRNLYRFLENGDKVKVTLRFRGREMVHQELGAKLLERITADLEEHAVVEQYPQMEGRQLMMLFSPRRKKAGRAVGKGSS